MGARRYASSDWTEVAGWYSARGARAPAADILPETGAIVPGVAAGFLYRTDSRLAILEGYVTNPAALLKERRKAVDCITSELLSLAHAQGFTAVVAWAASRGIQRTAMRFGFGMGASYVLMRKEL